MKFSKFILIAIFFLAVVLRFYNLSNNPPGLYMDEVSIGNNAYSILQTGRDEYGERYPLWFKSFGDYKLPVYIYSVSASMALFGKNEFAVRFPSALAGTLSVIILYFLLKELIKFDKNKLLKGSTYLPILSTGLLAISPWHLQFSRGGFEVNLAAFLYMIATFFVIMYFSKKRFLYLSLGFVYYILTAYTYHSYRILSPLTLIILISYIFWKIPKERIKLYSLSIFCFLLIIPVLQFSLTTNGTERFFQTSSFVEYPTSGLVEKLTVYPIVFIKNYFSYFSFDYLFSFGDGMGRHQIPGFGVLSRWQLPLIFIGIYYLIKEKRTSLKYFVLGILIISPIPASIARPSPHSLRSLLLVIPFMILTSLGLIFLLNHVRKWLKLSIILLSLVIVYEFLFYLHFYYIHYPKTNIIDWGGGYKKTVERTAGFEKKYYKIMIDENLNYALLYFNFYNKGLAGRVEVVPTSWEKPKEWGDKPVLYIRPYYGEKYSDKVISNIFLSNENQYIFAQFWEI